MPIYRYRCSNCQEEVELVLPIEKIDEPKPCVCGETLKRQVTTATFRLKNTGRNMVQDTLNREHRILPKEQVGIMSRGLNRPEVPVIGRGF